ncbi:bifunctional 4-hydroxy-2-oxoglutarate aldolase/2-dehydro-3-deoxy-phosphogluconate aldolase [Rhodobacter sp. NTK016B]|uniref:bifunctional 4-hydroxy-2-oxoglutarate aldolase/2-dehydro-3-deoxy-phosphogluconate aldolase n=1 Tax=Rhodobacter sp. NTK016B TaxID=2759676 RepID=UPI001A8FB2AD|nr:bifunctional 4-hydroxy-2-oxoglutarate aldolase/2-dehydro-3-deoxy-phosphogluconate aldolase [Rhodobacter sp. NTK016B]MBN8291509.1 bifunctional 4-hydroxy-2-oxoglutarate aldolase/2-dehydro-3-deoxy-phosphogluconate aldolase [Rhodobacter sp. NTK016B]
MNPALQSHAALALCKLAPVIPVIVVEDIDHAIPLAEALVAGGLPVLEVTLRTPCALEAIKAMSSVPGARVGAGTVLSAHDAANAKAAGATFAVSPGATPALIAACTAQGLPLLPGAASASEVMTLLELGYRTLKFFPAGPAGGPPMLKALSGPLPQATFCPTGGVSLENATECLSLPNVACVGGSWVAPAKRMAAGDWAGITELAREAAALPR